MVIRKYDGATKFICRIIVNYIVLSFLIYEANASVASYISLSNVLAKKTQLDTVANNTANANTVGYEADGLVFKNTSHIRDSKRKHSFVRVDSTYNNELQGSLQVTNRNLDIATATPNQYFKIITPRGVRYTLNGMLLISANNILVNSQGYPISNRNGEEILLPDQNNYRTLEIAKDGTIYNDADAIDEIGVFIFDPEDQKLLLKERDNLYITTANDILVDNYEIISGALRSSNVNISRAMADLINMQNSVKSSADLNGSIIELEKSTITKIAR